MPRGYEVNQNTLQFENPELETKYADNRAETSLNVVRISTFLNLLTRMMQIMGVGWAVAP